jgi:hypothetical protein
LKTYHGIQHQKFVAYTPQQNGVVELVNQTVVEAIHNMLQHSDLNPKFWAEVMNTISYLKARSSHKVMNGMTPEYAWSG